MALDKVKQEILEEAEDKADQIIEEAEEEADDIVSQAKQQAREIREDAQQKAEDEAESFRNQEIASARMEAKKLRMEAKQDVIDEAFSRLEERVSEMSVDERKDLFASVIETVGDDMDIGTIYTSADMVDAVEEMVDADVHEQDIQGLILEDADGSVRYDYSFASVLETIKDKHRKDVAQELFG